MPEFSGKSKARLSTCHPQIIQVMNVAIRKVDFTILHGHRGEAEQTKLYAGGLSKLQWPDSTHNKKPSLGIDIAPWPIDWEDRERFVFVAGIVLGVAECLGFNFRWGGDWDGDTDLHDQTFMDLGHFEVKPV